MLARRYALLHGVQVPGDRVRDCEAHQHNPFPFNACQPSTHQLWSLMHEHSSVGDSWQKMGWIAHQAYHTQGELMFPKFCISYRLTFMFVCVQLYRKCACITDRVSAGHIQPVFFVKIVSVIDKHLSTHVYTFIHTCICTCVQSCVCVCVCVCMGLPRELCHLLWVTAKDVGETPLYSVYLKRKEH